MNELLTTYTMSMYSKQIESCTNLELYQAILKLTLDKTEEQKLITGDKKLYYISSEFLIGKLLSNNLINLRLYDELKSVLIEHGKSILDIEKIENEPSIGNGGLGRLAACFIDSIATLDLPCDGVTINYHFGLFKQSFEDGLQKEYPNPWLTDNSWLRKTDITHEIKFGSLSVQSRMYEIDVLGYNGGVNKLKLFDVESVDESIVNTGISFDKKNIAKNLTLFLYPDDSDRDGHLLRIYQQYFMVSNAAQMIINDIKSKQINLNELAKHVVIQINDTHPTLVIPELMRLLVLEGLTNEQALSIVKETVAYTNHTILAEALEKWPVAYLQEVIPELVPIIKYLDDIIRQQYSDERVYLIDNENRVHMAHICIHFGFSVNGVAALHTDILKESELKPFYDLYPEKFNNKTNGITFRRWLLHANPELTTFIESLIGDKFKSDAMELKKLLAFENDESLQKRLREIKMEKKTQLSNHLQETQNVTIDVNSIIDIQVKRLHEYKRQQMNALYIVHTYFEIQKGNYPKTPITFIFGAKAAPAYTIAKDIIHMIITLGKIIDNDPVASRYIKVVFVENYNVTEAQYLFPAANVSEQISLASKEASGTGNMKFMLNGAITLGTADGANVEIEELVGEDNIYIFGKKSSEIIQLYKEGSYNSRRLCEENPHIASLVEFIRSPLMLQYGNSESLNRLYNEIISKDWFMTLIDLEDYIVTKNRCFADYPDVKKWAKMALHNIAHAGFFSSDRTIAEYNRDIWKLK